MSDIQPPPDDDWLDHWDYPRPSKTGVPILDKINQYGPTLFVATMFATVMLVMVACGIMIFGEAVRGAFG